MTETARVPRNSRQLKADETRSRIFMAATELFTKDGYHPTTIEKIALRAGVAKGTFFVHYPSKDAVVAEHVRIQVSLARQARAKVIAEGGSHRDALKAAVMALGIAAERSRALTRGVLTATLASQEVGGTATFLFDEVAADMRKDAQAAKREGELTPETDPATLTSSLMSCYLGAVLHFASSPRELSLLELMKPLVDSALRNAFRAETRSRKKSGGKSA